MTNHINALLDSFAHPSDESPHQHLDRAMSQVFMYAGLPHYRAEMDQLLFLKAAGIARGCGTCALILSEYRTPPPYPERWHDEVFDEA